MQKKNIHEHPYIMDCSFTSKEISEQEDCLRYLKAEEEKRKFLKSDN